MSYRSSSSSSQWINPGPSSSGGPVDMQHVQKKLHSLLQHLHWSYVALWSFNSQTRSLEWTGGHFAPAQRTDAQVWNDVDLFNLQKACIFTPGRGCVGTAFAEQRSIWRNGPSLHHSPGSEVQARILELARVETAVYIPSAETVLELGTSERVAEDLHLMNEICGYMWEHILPALGHALEGAPPPQVSQRPSTPWLSPHSESHEFRNPGFQELPDEPTRRAPTRLNLDMFLQHPEEEEDVELFGTPSSSGIINSETMWISSSPTPQMSLPSTDRMLPSPKSNPSLPLAAAVVSHPALMRSVQDYRSLPSTDRMLPSPKSKPSLPMAAAAVSHPALMRSFQVYRTLSGTTSSSLSSLEDSSFKLSEDSPEGSISLMAPSTSQRRNSHNLASSPARRESPSHSPELPLVDNPADGLLLPPLPLPHLHEDMHQAPRLLMAAPPLLHEPIWTQQQQMTTTNFDDPSLLGNPAALGLGFQPWGRPHYAPLPGSRERSRPNQEILRRSFEVLRHIRNLQPSLPHQQVPPWLQDDAPASGAWGGRLTSSSSPEDMPTQGRRTDQGGPSRRTKPSRRTTAAGATSEAAWLHTLSERERRKKQKEKLADLRKLVPIISKNDKASILGDATIYIKDLQVELQDAQAQRAEIQSQYEALKSSHQELQERYSKLQEAMEAAAGPATSPLRPPP